MNAGIDTLRHVLALFVIVQHMTSASRYSAITNELLGHCIEWMDGAVVGFFTISGYLFREPADTKAFLVRQSIRLLIPFYSFSLIYTGSLAVLGKSTLAAGLFSTLTLHGAGMQLYYLPLLLIVTVSYAAVKRVCGIETHIGNYVLVIALFACAYVFRTDSPTGSDVRLLPFYAGAFVFGVITRRCVENSKLSSARELISIVLIICAGLSDHRFLDLAAMILALHVAIRAAAHLPPVRIPGSGGIYLMHTPITNFAVSTALLHFGIVQGWNVLASVILTYLICLFATLAFIRTLPAHRWLILE